MNFKNPFLRFALPVVCAMHFAGCSPKDNPDAGPAQGSPAQSQTAGVEANDTAAGQGAPMDGAAFLEANKKKPGVTVTESGLQYTVIKSGSGRTPTTSDLVTTHYTGTLIDGTKFDSSVDRGQPATFRVSGVISGWTEALQLMKEGDKWKLFIPHELAYGEAGSPPVIPPSATLIFDIELIKVK